MQNIWKYSMGTYKILILFVLSAFVSSCLFIDIKSDFVETKYYNLENSKGEDFGEILNGDVFVYTFSVASDISEDAIMTKDESGIRVYHYHRWASSLGQMVRDYFIYELAAGNFTKGRILSKPSLSLPSYRVECRIHRWTAVDLDGGFAVELSVEISLLDKGNNLLVNKIYEKSIPREDEEVQSIAMAFGKAMGEVMDEFGIDTKKSLSRK